jgi:hypothetical protein
MNIRPVYGPCGRHSTAAGDPCWVCEMQRPFAELRDRRLDYWSKHVAEHHRGPRGCQCDPQRRFYEETERCIHEMTRIEMMAPPCTLLVEVMP